MDTFGSHVQNSQNFRQESDMVDFVGYSLLNNKEIEVRNSDTNEGKESSNHPSNTPQDQAENTIDIHSDYKRQELQNTGVFILGHYVENSPQDQCTLKETYRKLSTEMGSGSSRSQSFLQGEPSASFRGSKPSTGYTPPKGVEDYQKIKTRFPMVNDFGYSLSNYIQELEFGDSESVDGKWPLQHQTKLEHGQVIDAPDIELGKKRPRFHNSGVFIFGKDIGSSPEDPCTKQAKYIKTTSKIDPKSVRYQSFIERELQAPIQDSASSKIQTPPEGPLKIRKALVTDRTSDHPSFLDQDQMSNTQLKGQHSTLMPTQNFQESEKFNQKILLDKKKVKDRHLDPNEGKETSKDQASPAQDQAVNTVDIPLGNKRKELQNRGVFILGHYVENSPQDQCTPKKTYKKPSTEMSSGSFEPQSLLQGEPFASVQGPNPTTGKTPLETVEDYQKIKTKSPMVDDFGCSLSNHIQELKSRDSEVVNGKRPLQNPTTLEHGKVLDVPDIELGKKRQRSQNSGVYNFCKEISSSPEDLCTQKAKYIKTPRKIDPKSVRPQSFIERRPQPPIHNSSSSKTQTPPENSLKIWNAFVAHIKSDRLSFLDQDNRSNSQLRGQHSTLMPTQPFQESEEVKLEGLPTTALTCLSKPETKGQKRLRKTKLEIKAPNEKIGEKHKTSGKLTQCMEIESFQQHKPNKFYASVAIFLANELVMKIETNFQPVKKSEGFDCPMKFWNTQTILPLVYFLVSCNPSLSTWYRISTIAYYFFKAYHEMKILDKKKVKEDLLARFLFWLTDLLQLILKISSNISQQEEEQQVEIYGKSTLSHPFSQIILAAHKQSEFEKKIGSGGFRLRRKRFRKIMKKIWKQDMKKIFPSKVDGGSHHKKHMWDLWISKSSQIEEVSRREIQISKQIIKLWDSEKPVLCSWADHMETYGRKNTDYYLLKLLCTSPRTSTEVPGYHKFSLGFSHFMRSKTLNIGKQNIFHIKSLDEFLFFQNSIDGNHFWKSFEAERIKMVKTNLRAKGSRHKKSKKMIKFDEEASILAPGTSKNTV
ncbi:hypothetical protein CROQUDRAFT_134417 [Cronartium quercuum f. sp. fusiforme G11]|uniref:Uncharacterized protein n=1 Tax=Cronartium quercuum f. sp. fusiforme G11 TaxID=708437 RepID=A0A9P6NCS5_9BASI|nr:hypothetical protein CROQUDRAFT_134417 [Cronartium quercuum f. sp. fusiforme G11]